MRIGLVAQGSRGDVQPFLALGRALAARGVAVELAAPENFAQMAGRAGIAHAPMAGDTQALMQSERGRRVLARGDLVTWGREMWAFQRAHWYAHADTVEALAARSDALVVHPLSLPFAIATARVPVALGLAFPMGFGARAYAHPMLGSIPGATKLPPSARAATHRIGERLFWAPHAPLVARRRRVEGDGFAILRRDRALVLRAWDPALVPDDPSHVPPPTGAWAIEGLDPPLAPALDAWIGVGDPPVYVGFGSLPILDRDAGLAMLSRVTARLGVRALVASGWSEASAASGDHLRIVGALDHASVLPRCRAAIHHGGAGTLHASLAAGLPTLVIPVYADQPFWGARVEALGVGASLRARSLDEPRLEEALARVLEPAVRERARALGAAMISGGADRAAAHVIARLAA